MYFVFYFLRKYSGLTFFIALVLFTGNSHQAVEKQRNDDVDLSFLYEPVVHFNTDYELFIERQLDSILGVRRFNGTVLLSHKGKAVYNKSFGYSRMTGQMPFEAENNVFQLASVGKQFTAIATLILYERGLIGLDDPVNIHIHNFPYPEITVRHLLNHTSGLQNYFYVVEKHWDREQLPTHDDMLEMFISRSLPLNFTPGRSFSYSNTGYAFLALLIERVSGEPFHEFLQNHVFAPLKMGNSFVFHPGIQIREMHNVSLGYDRAGRGFREINVENLDGITGDKGIFSSAEDLLRWDNALERNLLISEETRQMAFSMGKVRNGHSIGYGFGYRIRQLPGHDIIYHNGWWRGFRTAYVRLPGNTLLVILNNTNASITGLDEQIRRILNNSPFSVIETQGNTLANK
jgi:CubicO group peptidase (beta-lactamase class C family)